MIVRSTLALAVVAVAAWLTLSRPAAPVAASVAPPAADAHARPAPLPSLVAAADEAEQSRRTTYRLTYEVDSELEGRPGPRVVVAGDWTVESLSDDRVAMALSAARIEGHELAPTAEAAERSVELRVEDGVLTGVGFQPGTDQPARRLLSGLATLLWPALPPESEVEPTWTVEQADQAGAHLARYTRTSGQGARATVERRVERVLALRSAGGLEPLRGEQVATAGVSVFAFDEAGLVEARIVDDRTLTLANETLTVVTRTRATLRRLDTQVVDRRGPAPFPMAGFSAEIDFAGQAAFRDDQKVDGADLPTLLKALDDALALDPQGADTAKWRHRALERLTALLRVDPAVAPQIAALLGRMAADDPRFPFLAGALSGANTPDATNALASVLAGDVSGRARHGVHTNLALTAVATPESVRALEADLSGERGSSAAMALGAQAGKLEGEEAESIIEILLRRYQEATTPAEKIAALKALGNSGHPAILGVVTEALGQPGLAAQAVRALRFVPGPEVDALLAVELGRGTYAWATIEAIGHRDGGLWGPRLTEARTRFAEDARLVAQIDRILAEWN